MLTIGGTAYSAAFNNTITQKVKIEKDTAVSAIIEKEENPAPAVKYKITITQPANGTIEVVPALPADGMVDKGSELTFRLSANAGYKVKALTIGDATYSDVTDNTITKKVKIEKETAVSAVVEEEATPTPETGIFTDTQGNKVTIAPVEAYGGEIIGYRLTGDIYIEEINSEAFKAKLNTLNGKELYTDSLNINCFTNQNSTITAKEITPELLTGVLTIGEERKFSAFRLNNQTSNGPIDIKFDSTVEKSFDITDLTKFSFSDNFKLENNSNIILGSTAEKQGPSGHDITPYPKVHELLKLLNNEKLKDYITVKDVYITGNVKDLLPKLIGPNKIKETNGGVKFLNVKEFKCPGPNVTEYNGGNNNTEPLPVEQLLEFRRRTDEKWNSVLKKDSRSTRIQNLVLNNVNTTTMTEEDLKLLNFEGNSVTGNIVFKNSNLSKMQYRGTTGPVDLTFDNTTLPTSMESVTTRTLVLKNAILPEELKTLSLGKVIKRLPFVNESLQIYNLQNNFLDNFSKEEIEKFERKKYGPEEFVGPRYIWDKFLYKKETEFGTPTIFIEDNTTGSIQEPQATSLALLGNSKAHG